MCVGNARQRVRHLPQLNDGEMAGEVLLDRVEVRRRGVAQCRSPVCGQRCPRNTGVDVIGLFRDEPGGGHCVNEAADAGPAQHHSIAELTHMQPTARCGVEFEQHVVPRQRDVACVAHVRFDCLKSAAVGQ